MMHSTLLCALLWSTPSQLPPASTVPSPAPQATPAPAAAADSATPPKEEVGPVEQAINRIPPVLWEKDAGFNTRLGKLASLAVTALGVACLALTVAGVGFTAALQLSPWPKDSDYRERPRSTFIMAAMAITSGLAILGVVGTLGGLFALFIA